MSIFEVKIDNGTILSIATAVLALQCMGADPSPFAERLGRALARGADALVKEQHKVESAEA